MITDRRAAELCAALYQLPLSGPGPFDVVDNGDDGGVCRALAREGDTDVIVLRGSVTGLDWLRDVFALPYTSRRMGPVHHGFYLGMQNVWDDMKILLRPDAPVVITGHSLGAARAAILTGMMVEAGRPPAARIVFGEPKPGYAQLADFIKSVPARSYRAGDGAANHDIVTDQALPIPGLHYVHPTPLTLLQCIPDPNDQSGPFVFHHMNLYLAGVSALKA